MLAKNERMKNGDRPAHPFNAIEHGYQPSFGLTKFEYFAGLAMQGLLTRVPKREGGQTDLGQMELERIVVEARLMADALLAELEKTER